MDSKLRELEQKIALLLAAQSPAKSVIQKTLEEFPVVLSQNQ